MSKILKKSLPPKVVGRLKRHRRVRSKVFGTEERPRLCVFKSGKHIYAQIIDDTHQKVLFQVSSLTRDLKLKNGANVEAAQKVGESTAKKSLAQKINKVVFDTAGYRYHGRIKALAEAARKGGLQF